MTKEELKVYFSENGDRKLPKTDKAWQILFDLYKKETKNRLSLSCGGCYSVAYKWLQK